MTRSAALFVSLIVLTIIWDYSRLRRSGTRVLLFEIVVLCGGAVLVLFPDIAQALAQWWGVGRGVDFISYLLFLWLLREAIVSRQLRHEENQRATEIVRELAIQHARRSERTPK
jgi:hypothetical protein